MKRVLIYLVKRVLLYALIFLMSLTVFFFVINLVPGDPVTRYVQEMSARYGVTIQASDAVIQEYKKEFNLDKRLGGRYLAFMDRLVFHFDFGPSFLSFPKPAKALILDALPWSIGLLGISVVLAWVVGMVLGTLVGWRRQKVLDSTLTPIGMVAAQIPPYLFALILAMGLAYAVGIFPTGSAYSPMFRKGFNLPYILNVIYHAVLPSMSLVLIYMFTWMITQRALVINLIGEDFMRLAEAKGLTNARMVNRYVLRNTLLPQTTGLALSLGFIVNGFFLIEWIYRYPGIGNLFLSAIRALDYNVLLGTTVITMFCVLAANLLIEMLYPFIDPRIRRG